MLTPEQVPALLAGISDDVRIAALAAMEAGATYEATRLLALSVGAARASEIVASLAKARVCS